MTLPPLFTAHRLAGDEPPVDLAPDLGLAALPFPLVTINWQGDCLEAAVGRPESRLAHLRGRRLTEVLSAENAALVIAQVQRVLQTRQPAYVEYQEGAGWWAAEMAPADGERVVALLHDISARKQEEYQRRLAERDLRNKVTESAVEMQIKVTALEQRNREINLLGEQSRLLQACLSSEEACAILTRMGPGWLPGQGGVVYLMRASRNLLEVAAEWGEWHGERAFAPEESWALRTGGLHFIGDTATQAPLCAHVGPPLPGSYLSVPLVAQGDTLGLLHLQGPTGAFDDRRAFVQTASEQMGLALANLKLREALRQMSTRDLLTGLYNRRYMEEMLEREIARSDRNDKPLAALLMDIDHFKTFNDSQGHAAGDLVLQTVAEAIRAMVRGTDIPCRYGGEELVVMLPETELEAARAKAEAIRQKVAGMQVQYQGGLLPQVTVSIGVAARRAHGLGGAELVRAADEAMYRGKQAGRNRVMAAVASTAV